MVYIHHISIFEKGKWPKQWVRHSFLIIETYWDLVEGKVSTCHWHRLKMLVFPHPPVSELTCGNSAIWVMVPGCICRQGQFVLAEVSGVCVCSICPGSGCITPPPGPSPSSQRRSMLHSPLQRVGFPGRALSWASKEELSRVCRI